MGEGDAGLRHPQQLHCLGCCDTGTEHAGRSHSDVLAGQDHQPTCDEPRILPRLQHSRQVVQGRINIGAPHGFDESGDHIVVLVTISVVAHSSPIHRMGEHLGGDLHKPECLGRSSSLLEVGQRTASIPAGQTHQVVSGRIGQGNDACQAFFID